KKPRFRTTKPAFFASNCEKIAQKFISLEIVNTFLEKINLLTDKHTLSLVLSNLISNALKYSGDQQLNITGKKSGENYILTFSNAINSPLNPLKQVEKTAMTASHLGLIIAQEAAEKLGGKLNLKQERQNFIVKFTMPIER
ncbi:MAG: ATP-binding protein, partial [Lactobacillales bacterium]|nr:ATP-binding protein [Lactobacillales bacterium]